MFDWEAAGGEFVPQGPKFTMLSFLNFFCCFAECSFALFKSVISISNLMGQFPGTKVNALFLSIFKKIDEHSSDS